MGNHRRIAEIYNFNPRTHRGVRHKYLNGVKGTLVISIHAPIVGCDIDPEKDITVRAEIISIHAPIVGCDIDDIITFFNSSDFNPRTHRGVRRQSSFNLSNCS